jgi:hypothetical protein
MRDFTSSATRFLLASLLLTLVFGLTSYAQDPTTGKSAAAPGQARTAAASPQPIALAQPAIPARPVSPIVNPVTQAALQAGVLTSVSRINQVTTFLTANSKSSAFLFVPQSQPDQSIFSVSFGLEREKAAARYASASFVPTYSGQAGAVYDTVEYVAQSCADVETTTFKDLKRKGNLGKDIVILDGGPVTVFLMPAGSGCVVIKKEVVQ